MMDIPASTAGSNTARRRPFDSQSSTTQNVQKIMSSNDEKLANNGANGAEANAVQPQQRPNPWSQATATSSGTATGSPPVSSSPLIGEVQMPSDWMKPKGPMADLFGGGSSVSPQQPPPRPQ